MFQVRSGSRCATQHSRIEQAATRGQQREHRETASDLEAEVVDVVVRNAITGEVDERTEKKGDRPRAGEGAGRSAGRDMERDDHVPIIAYDQRP